MTCAADLVIHIFAAYYGIQRATGVRHCLGADLEPNSGSSSATSEMPEMCFFSNTLSKAQTSCENKKTCLLEASVNNFGDPCPHFNKQLFIQYQCMDSGELSAMNANCAEKSQTREIPFVCPLLSIAANSTGELFERTWCDGSTMSIQCGGQNETIQVLCAFYGVHTALTSCNIQNLANPPICFTQRSFDRVSTFCNGTKSCGIDNFTSTFSDPCVGFDKALYVQWKCNK